MTHWRYGSYSHPAGEVDLTRMNIRYRMSPRGRRLSRIITMFIQGEICADGQSKVSERIDELIAAYSNDYQNCGLYDNNGNLTRHNLQNDSADCISGVHVLQRSWPKGGDEYATGRTFSVTIEAEYADVDDQIVSWEESLRFIGNCGPRYDIIETYRGPFPVLTALRTAQRIVQSGSAVGYLGYVEPPGSLFPDIEHQHLRDIDLGSGKLQGQAAAFYPTRWTYIHSSGVNRSGVPTTR